MIVEFILGRVYQSEAYPTWIGECVYAGRDVAVLKAADGREWAPHQQTGGNCWIEYQESSAMKAGKWYTHPDNVGKYECLFVTHDKWAMLRAKGCSPFMTSCRGVDGWKEAK